MSSLLLQHYSLLVCAHEMTVKQLAEFGALPKNSLDAAQHTELADNSAEALPGRATSRVCACAIHLLKLVTNNWL